MKAVRDAHKAGGTRVCMRGDYILSGGHDGVVRLFKKNNSNVTALWALECHAKDITGVELDATLQLGFTCGRDGQVILHEEILSESHRSRVICRVTGELRCLYFDAPRKRLFVGGDSFRCLQLRDDRFNISDIPLPIKHPIVSLALSPCGNLMAMANTFGAVAVVPSFSPAAVAAAAAAAAAGAETQSQLTQTSREKEEEELAALRQYGKVRVVLHKVLSPTVERDDQVAYRLSWAEKKKKDGSTYLFVPGWADVQIYKLLLEHAAGELRPIGSIGSGNGLQDFHCVSAFKASERQLSCILCARNGVVSMKVSNKDFVAAPHKERRFTDLEEEGHITDLCVCPTSGDTVVGTDAGKLFFGPRFAIKAPSDKKSATAEGEEEEEQEPKEKKSKKNKAAAPADAEQEDGLTAEKENHDETSNHSNSDDSGSSSSSSSNSNSDSDSDGDGLIKEDFSKVVKELKESNADYIEADTKRPSVWRKKNKERAMIEAHKNFNYLDDEAMEASSSDSESSAEEGFGDSAAEGNGDGMGGYARLPRRNTNEEEEEEEGENADDDDDDGDDDDHHQQATGLGSGTGAAVAAGTSALLQQDYFFQIGATPTGEEGCCYLAYNSTGFIFNTGENTTIHFHDMSLPAVRIVEKGVVLMGCLSPVGAGFVVAPNPEAELDVGTLDDEGSSDMPRLTIYYRTFAALGAQSEWRVQLQAGETVRCMTAGISHVAVATNRYLRLYSISGLELACLSKFPRIVAMVGTTSEKLMRSFKAFFDPLAIAYLDGNALRVEVLDVGSRTTVFPSCVVPLTEDTSSDGTSGGAAHQLQWMGWSEDGPLHVADTAGVVRLFTQAWGGSWVPVYDPRAMREQSYNLWIWGVNDRELLAYPSAITDPPYPAAVASGLRVDNVPLFLPLTKTGNDMVAWDQLLRREIRTDEIKRLHTAYTAVLAKHDALHDKKLLELFHAALKEQRTSRALDLATLLELRDNVEVCAKAANAAGQGQLVQRLLALYKRRVDGKLKRRCTLPLEERVVKDKERDALLQKLIKEKAAATTATLPPTAATTASATATTTTTATAAAPAPETAPEPAPSAATTTSSDAARTRRHVTFNVPELAPSTVTAVPAPKPAAVFSAPAQKATATAPATTTTNTTAPSATAAAAQPLKKATNPFQHRTTTTIINNNNNNSNSTTSTTPTPTSITTNTTTTPTTHANVKPSGSAPPAVPVAAAPAPTPVRPQKTGGASGEDDSPSDRRSAGHTSARTSFFVPKTLPTPTTIDKRPIVVDTPPSQSTEDPFLANGEETASSATVTMEAFLDVGHEDSGFVARTSSFGEALRKRYRDDDEDEDSSAAPPVPLLPRIE